LNDVELARAYGRSNPVTGEIVAVDVVPRPGANTDRLADEIRAACEALPPAARPRRIRFVDELDLRGHKIVRGHTTSTK
jgi:acyl-coenzyme A synthetase/AMP-(fatty) acid ligase